MLPDNHRDLIDQAAHTMDPVAYDERAVADTMGKRWDRTTRQMTAVAYAENLARAGMLTAQVTDLQDRNEALTLLAAVEKDITPATTVDDLTARLGAADLLWSHELGDPPAEPNYIQALARRVATLQPSYLRAHADRYDLCQAALDPIDYTQTECEEPAAEENYSTQRALASIREMRRLLAVREQRLVAADVARTALESQLAALPEWNCPGCGATTRARMADHAAQNDRGDREPTSSRPGMLPAPITDDEPGTWMQWIDKNGNGWCACGHAPHAGPCPADSNCPCSSLRQVFDRWDERQAGAEQWRANPDGPGSMTMTDLEIPDEAAEAASVVYDVKHLVKKGHRVAIADALKAAAPLIVAAELERLADDYRARHQSALDNCPVDLGNCSTCRQIRSRIDTFNQFLTSRARQLRGAAASPSEETTK